LQLSNHSDERDLEVSDAQFEELEMPPELFKKRALAISEERVQLGLVVLC